MRVSRTWRDDRRNRGLPALLATAALAAAFAGVATHDGDGDHTAYASRHHERPDTVVTVGPSTVGHPIPSGFVGLSLEYSAVPWYTGTDAGAVNPVFEQLIRNLSPGQSPVLRIGGDSTDTTWVPTPGIPRPAGVSYSLSPTWLATTAALARDLRARMIMGIDLEAGVPALAAAEARAFVARFGPRALRAFEISNEAPRYNTIPWYRRGPGHLVYARRPSYDFGDFNREFATVAGRLPAGVPIAGPTLGGPGWMPYLEKFIASEPRLGLLTFHTYPFNRCFTPVNSPTYPSLSKLLSLDGSRGFAPAIEGYLATARRHRLPFRIDEMNSVACGGKRGISDTFASALWALDSTFEMARLGVSGVNFHMFPGASYILFSFRREGAGQWVARVMPEYYGLLMFAQAAPPGSRLLSTAVRGARTVRAWATRATGGTVRAVLINDDVHRRHVFLVRGLSSNARADVIRLSAPSVRANGGVTLGEQRFGLTRTGKLSEAPEAEPVGSSHGRLVVTLGPASAALLTVRRG
ncbi:MAG TPA: glycosyl hydrolase family 79 C-terminal domain-containing protein [Solirubrobacteraceae bacterium]